jgi:hypothetical protein
MSVIERFLVFADPNGPVTKAPGHQGPHKESNDSHQFTNATPKGFSNGRDSRFGLARADASHVQPLEKSHRAAKWAGRLA